MKQVQFVVAKRYLWYVALFLCGTVFLLFYSVSTSPLTYNTYGTDSAFFQMVGQNMRKGLVMYRDIFDTKGPYFFLIQYIGQTLFYGRYGTFLLQILNLFLTLIIIDKTFTLTCEHAKPVHRVILFFIFFVILSFTIDQGNLTEEYSILPLFLCMYLFFQYLMNGRRHICLCALAFGGVFGYLAFIRLTNASFVCVLICVVFVELLIDRKFLLILQTAFSFMLGVVFVSLPICVYYLSKKALSDMLYAVFAFSFSYAVRTPGTIRYTIVSILLVVAVAAAVLNRRERPFFLFSIMSLMGTVLVLLLGNGYIHYYQLLLPPVIGNLLLVFRKRDVNLARKGKKLFITTFIIAILSNCMLFLSHGGRVVVAMGLNTPRTESTVLGQLAHKIEYLDSYGFGTYGYDGLQKIEEVTQMIPKESVNSVYNYNTRPIWLLATTYIPYNKYCETQDLFIQSNPAIAEEIDEMFDQNPPDYVVTEISSLIQNERMNERLETMYHVVFSNDLYMLYEKND